MTQCLIFALTLMSSPTVVSVPLLELGRSKNANVVVYAARVGPDGALDEGRPFEAHWVLRAGDGRSEPLNVVEELLAYGFSWKSRRPGHAYGLTMNAFRERSLEVVPHDNGYQVVTSVGGVPSRLIRIFVTAEEGSGLPQVKSVDLIGESLRDGSPTHERIAPTPRATRGHHDDAI